MNPQINFLIQETKEKELIRIIKDSNYHFFYPAGDKWIQADDGTRIMIAYITDYQHPIPENEFLGFDPHTQVQYFYENPWVEYSAVIEKKQSLILSRLFLQSSILTDPKMKKRMMQMYNLLKKIIVQMNKSGQLTIV